MNKFYAIFGLALISLSIINGVHYAGNYIITILSILWGSWIFSSSIIDEIRISKK